MTATIVCRATSGMVGPWLRLRRQGSEWAPEAQFNDLRQAIDGTLLASSFTFSTRGRAEAIAAYAENPEDLEKLGIDSHAMILCPEGAPIENRWTALHRLPVSGAVIGSGLEGRFRPRPDVLLEKVIGYFERAQWRSFAPQKVSERHEPAHQQAQRPLYARELLVRHNWAAREIAPKAFPSAATLAQREAHHAAVQAAHEGRLRAKNPRLKRPRTPSPNGRGTRSTPGGPSRG